MPKRLEVLIETVILASRWLLVIFYLGLALALGVYAISFGAKLLEFVTKVSALFLAFIDRVSALTKGLGKAGKSVTADKIQAPA